MALIVERTEWCGKKVLDNAGIVRDACLQQLTGSCALPFGTRLETLLTGAPSGVLLCVLHCLFVQSLHYAVRYRYVTFGGAIPTAVGKGES
jgi:hypothetical protein